MTSEDYATHFLKCYVGHLMVLTATTQFSCKMYKGTNSIFFNIANRFNDFKIKLFQEIWTQLKLVLLLIVLPTV